MIMTVTAADILDQAEQKTYICATTVLLQKAAARTDLAAGSLNQARLSGEE